MELRPFKRVLIANRGEIAVRIIRGCHERGIEAIAVYSEADASAPHVRLADGAFCVGPAASSESYLRTDKILEGIGQTRGRRDHDGIARVVRTAATQQGDQEDPESILHLQVSKKLFVMINFDN